MEKEAGQENTVGNETHLSKGQPAWASDQNNPGYTHSTLFTDRHTQRRLLDKTALLDKMTISAPHATT